MEYLNFDLRPSKISLSFGVDFLGFGFVAIPVMVLVAEVLGFEFLTIPVMVLVA